MMLLIKSRKVPNALPPSPVKAETSLATISPTAEPSAITSVASPTTLAPNSSSLPRFSSDKLSMNFPNWLSPPLRYVTKSSSARIPALIAMKIRPIGVAATIAAIPMPVRFFSAIPRALDIDGRASPKSPIKRTKASTGRIRISNAPPSALVRGSALAIASDMFSKKPATPLSKPPSANAFTDSVNALLNRDCCAAVDFMAFSRAPPCWARSRRILENFSRTSLAITSPFSIALNNF